MQNITENSSYDHVPFPTAIFIAPTINENGRETFRRKLNIA